MIFSTPHNYALTHHFLLLLLLLHHLLVQLVPTIIIAMFMNQKKVYKYDLIFGIMISLGMVFFAFADMTVYPDANALGTPSPLLAITLVPPDPCSLLQVLFLSPLVLLLMHFYQIFKSESLVVVPLGLRSPTIPMYSA